MTPNRSPIDNPSRYNPGSSLAPGIDPFGQYPHDAKPEVASTVMQTYPPPQLLPAQVNGYSNYAMNNGQNYPNQTYPGLQQQPPKPQNGFTNGLQIPTQAYQNSQFGMNPVSAVQQQAMYTDSPVDTTAFPNYFNQETPDLTNDMSGMGYETTNTMQFQQPNGTYQAMAYLNTQHNYQQYQQQ
jgi:hypothetical protein